jgi:osmotically-inducible protein OsmY
MLAVLSCRAALVSAGDEATPITAPLQTIVVHGKPYPDSVPDEVLSTQVKSVLHDDPFFYDEHVTIIVTNGIVHLEGFVLDYRDIKDVLRLIKRKFPHLKRVVNELEILREDSDDG